MSSPHRGVLAYCLNGPSAFRGWIFIVPTSSGETTLIGRVPFYGDRRLLSQDEAYVRMSVKVPLIYFAFSNVIFVAGVHGMLDSFFWGFLSFIIYWPFSHVTHQVWHIIQGTPPSIDNNRLVFLGLSKAQLLIYSLDVIAGTTWWWVLSLSIGKLRARSRLDNASEPR